MRLFALHTEVPLKCPSVALPVQGRAVVIRRCHLGKQIAEWKRTTLKFRLFSFFLRFHLSFSSISLSHTDLTAKNYLHEKEPAFVFLNGYKQTVCMKKKDDVV